MLPMFGSGSVRGGLGEPETYITEPEILLLVFTLNIGNINMVNLSPERATSPQ